MIVLVVFRRHTSVCAHMYACDLLLVYQGDYDIVSFILLFLFFLNVWLASNICTLWGELIYFYRLWIRNALRLDIFLLMRRKRKRKVRKRRVIWINRTKWPYPFSNVFTSPEPVYPIVEKLKYKPDLAKDPEKFEEPFVCLDILQAIFIKSQ